MNYTKIKAYAAGVNCLYVSDSLECEDSCVIDFGSVRNARLFLNSGDVPLSLVSPISNTVYVVPKHSVKKINEDLAVSKRKDYRISKSTGNDNRVKFASCFF